MPLPKYRVTAEPPGGFRDCPWLSVGGVYDGLEAPGAHPTAVSWPIRLYSPGGTPHHYDLPPDVVVEVPPAPKAR
jgi:hypothetical protein